ncbi:MAG: hypothetical protein QXK12_03210 [Candidatus Nezhaarchaeales archaeon]
MEAYIALRLAVKAMEEVLTCRGLKEVKDVVDKALKEAGKPLQAGITLKVNFGNPREIVIPNELLTMLSEGVRGTVMNEALDANQRFKVLVEGLHWHKGVSVRKLSKCFGVTQRTLLR